MVTMDVVVVVTVMMTMVMVKAFFLECGVFGGTPVWICVFAVESVEQKIVSALLRHEPLHKQSDRGRRHDNDKL